MLRMNYSHLLGFLICTILLSSGAFATIPFDDFEDGDYTNNPTWTHNGVGTVEVQNTTKFEGTYSLKLTSAADTSEVTTPKTAYFDKNYGVYVNTADATTRNVDLYIYEDGTPCVDFSISHDRLYYMNGVTYSTLGSFVPTDNNWYYLEIFYTDEASTATYTIYDANTKGVLQRTVANVRSACTVNSIHLLAQEAGGKTGYFDYVSLAKVGAIESLTANFSYSVNKSLFAIDVNDLSTHTSAITDYNWLVGGVKVSDDQNYTKVPVTEKTDYNFCLQVSDGSLFSQKCTTINTGNFYGDTNFFFYDENTSLPIAATLDFNGTAYTGTYFNLNSQQITNDSAINTKIDFNISMSGYGTRYYSLDMNQYSDLNVGFALLPSTMGSNVDLKVYQLDGNTIYNNVFVELIKPDKGNVSVGRFKTDSAGNGTVFLSLIDSNYTSKVNNNTNTYYPVMLSILYPKNEASLAQITEKWKIDITQNLFLSFTDLNTTKVLYLIPNTNLPFNIKIQDVNGNYFSRTYVKQYAGNPLTDTLQPYLVSSATGLLTTINSISATTTQPLTGITFKVYKNISGSGRTLVETVTTDSKGQALVLLVLNADYEFEAYNGVTFIKTFTITATSATIYFIIDLGSVVVNPPVASGFSASWTPGNGLTKSTTGTQVFTQTLQNFGGSTISIASTLTQGGANLSAPQAYSGSALSKAFTYTINWTDINVGNVVSKMIVTNSDGNVYTFTQTYIVSTSYGSGYTPMQGLQTGLRSDLQCSSNALIPCYPLLIIAVIICIALGLMASMAMGQYGSQSAGVVMLIGMILFTYLTWIPLWLTAGLVIIMLAFIINERRS